MAEQATRTSQPVWCCQHRVQPMFSSKLTIGTWVLGGMVEERESCVRPTSPASVTIVDTRNPVEGHSTSFATIRQPRRVVVAPPCFASLGSTSNRVRIHLIVTWTQKAEFQPVFPPMAFTLGSIAAGLRCKNNFPARRQAWGSSICNGAANGPWVPGSQAHPLSGHVPQLS
jgi:hypothetical protein